MPSFVFKNVDMHFTEVLYKQDKNKVDQICVGLNQNTETITTALYLWSAGTLFFPFFQIKAETSTDTGRVCIDVNTDTLSNMFVFNRKGTHECVPNHKNLKRKIRFGKQQLSKTRTQKPSRVLWLTMCICEGCVQGENKH